MNIVIYFCFASRVFSTWFRFSFCVCAFLFLSILNVTSTRWQVFNYLFRCSISYHCWFLIPDVFPVMFPCLEIPQGPQTPFPPPLSPLYLGKYASMLALSCLVLAAIVELTLSCGRWSRLSIWQQPMSTQWSLDLNKKKPLPLASDYAPGQRRGWGSNTFVEWGVRFSRERWRKACIILPFIESLPCMSCWAGP